MTAILKYFPILMALAMLVGCGANRNPLPVDLQQQATVPGFDNIRFYGDTSPAEMKPLMDHWLEQKPQAQNTKDFVALSLSGGGSGGAFGAGFLSGWTKSGKRPQFNLVTGVSTGALIAPFAFLGPGYDELIKLFYTTYSTDNLVGYTPTRQSLLNTDPLRKTLKQHITKELVELIALAHSKGRRLIIGTTNLDEMRPVYWDIGEIAQHNTKEARQMIRDIIQASAAIPVAFPPVYFEVLANGQTYDEMHVDGGITNQLFSYPPSIRINEALKQIGDYDRITLYVIRNDLVATPGRQVNASLTDIASRSMDGLIRNQGIGDIYRIYYTANRDGVDFNLAFIPSSFNEKSEEIFDTNYMNKLFKIGYDKALGSTPWYKKPPYDLNEK